MNQILSFVSTSLVFLKKYDHIKQRKWKFFCKVVLDENEVFFIIKTCQIWEKAQVPHHCTVSMQSEKL